MENCSCIKDEKYKFTLDYRDDYLIYTDFSEWVTSNKNTPIVNYKIDIANGESVKTFTVIVGSSTIIKYVDLPRNCEGECNFDGVYAFKVTACQETQIFEKTEAIVQSLMCAYDQLILKDDWNNAYKLLKYIEYVKVYSRYNLKDKAFKYYNIAVDLIKNLKCNCNELM